MSGDQAWRAGSVSPRILRAIADSHAHRGLTLAARRNGSESAAMRITYITAGAAGMFCGSCMRDNTLVAALGRRGHDALLVPCYTPIRTDEEDVSQKRVFFGGVNVYLQQKWSLFRHTPWFLDRLLDARVAPALGVALRRQDAGRRPRRPDRLHAQGRTRKTEQRSRQARPMAGGGGQAAGRQPDQRHPVRHGPRAEAGRRRPGPLLAARRRHLPRRAAGAVSDASAPADPRPLPRDRRLHRHLRLLRRLHGGVFRHPARAHPRRLSGAEPARPRRPAPGRATAGPSPSAISPASAPKRGCTSWPRRSGCCGRPRRAALPAARLRLARRNQ